MTSPVVTVKPSTLLLDAALTLRSAAMRHLPVVEDGFLVGLISDRDIQRCAPSRLIPISEEGYNAVFSDTPVSRVMTREPLSIPPDTTLIDAINLMQESRYGCLPVVENNALVGILTRGDLVEILLRLLTGKPIARPSDSA